MKKQNLFKKSLSVLLVLVMAMSTLVLVPMTASAEAPTNAWDGTATEAPTGTGTQSNPYQIASGANLAWLGAYIPQTGTIYVTLTADVNMGGAEATPAVFTPINTDAAVIFDGDGKTIYNLKTAATLQYAGLFGTVGDASSFDDVHFVGAAVEAVEAAGCLVGSAKGALTVTNCTTDATTTVISLVSGGLVGRFDEVAKDRSFSHCVNRASISAIANTVISQAGGLLGYVKALGDISFTYCVNEGDIYLNAGECSTSSAGGLVGLVQYVDQGGKTTTFENCYNIGSIEAVADVQTKDITLIGGLGGWIRPTYLRVKNCFDYSVRNIAALAMGKHGAIIGDVPGAETFKTYTNVYAVNNADSVTSYQNIYAYNDVAGQHTLIYADKVASVMATLNAPITVTDPANESNSIQSTVLAEITKIATVVGTTPPAVQGGGQQSLPLDYSWYYANGSLVEKGTEAAPYEIASGAQWAAFAALSNGSYDATAVGAATATPVNFDGKFFKLTADIDLDGYYAEPVDMNVTYPTIVLDGCGKSISNLTQEDFTNSGLFASLGDGSVIKNVTVKNADITSKGVGSIFVAKAEPGLTFLNCRSDADCTVTATGNVGGFVADMINKATESKTSFTVCVNEADLSTNNAANKIEAGGFIGHGYGGTDFSFDWCVNKGDIKVENGDWNNTVGGFIGWLQYPGDGPECNLVANNCYNTGKLTSLGTRSQVPVGGFIAWANFLGYLEITTFLDYSVRIIEGRTPETEILSGALVGDSASDDGLVKLLDGCYGLNAPGSESLYSAIGAKGFGGSSLLTNSEVITTTTELTAPVTINGVSTTFAEAMGVIDALLASVNPVTGEFTPPADPEPDPDPDPNPDPDPDPNPDTNPGTGDNNNVDNNSTQNAETTTTVPAEEEPGCGGTLNSTYAVIALVAVLGFAFVAKKREEN